MANVDKEIVWLQNEILPKILNSGRLIENYNPKSAHTFKVHKIDINIIGSEEAFMLTTCYRAEIHYEYENQKNILKFVVKRTPAVPLETYDAINFTALFGNEVDFYTRILPVWQKIAGGQFAASKYYYSEVKRDCATIILEDFSINGWRVTKDKVNLSLEHLLLAVKYLGNFHGIGFALKQTNRELFDELIGNLKESRYANDEVHPEWALTMKATNDRMLKVTLKLQPSVDANYAKTIHKLMDNFISYGRQRVAPREPLATLCHGDYLRNNVAYRYDKTDEVPIDIMMFDYQTLRYSSPMVDLTVFLNLSAFHEVRHTHFEEIFNVYCTELAKTYTQKTGETLPDYLSRENLLTEYIRYLPYSLNVTNSFLMTLIDPKHTSTEEMLNETPPPEEVYEDCMQRGGEITDMEIAHQVKELYDLSQQYNVNVTEGIKF